jgi:hypothetical protein
MKYCIIKADVLARAAKALRPASIGLAAMHSAGFIGYTLSCPLFLAITIACGLWKKAR